MKLDRSMSDAWVTVIVAGVACVVGGCQPRADARTAIDGRTATTELMSARIVETAPAHIPAPKVGKSHLVDDDVADPLGTPKDERGSDGSRRTGNFGATK